ncbi:MAG: non-homologous end-joining DNA ligase [Actinomycetota bacterium]|nr:non-homologous end-joining DNA ligase [Actinomycetota bacterium]
MAGEYQRKRRFEETPEPVGGPSVEADPTTAPPGERFVIQQHHATRLHLDLRLEMRNGPTPVLVSWAVPRGLPRRRGERSLAIHTEDHPIEYGTFSGTIPEGNYGAGEVRIFDAGRYEILERTSDRLTVRLGGERAQGVYHLVRTGEERGKEQWLVILKEDERPQRQPPPPPRPMLATLVEEPFDDPEWAFEPKWDGIRAIAVCNEETALVSRNRKDITAAYPELHSLHQQLVALEAMVDGEIIALEGGVPSFELLQGRMHVRGPREVERLSRIIPVTYMAFDLLYLDGRDLTRRPFDERRGLLEETVVPSDVVQVSPVVAGEGRALFAAAAARSLEGVVAKRRSSRYESGKRSSSWRKVKTTAEADLVVVGWTEGEGRRAGGLGALTLAAFQDGVLRHVGNVGTGFTEQTLRMLEEELRPLAVAEPPVPKEALRDKPELRRVHWVEPRLVASVEFRQLTSDGKLRAPSFRGLREDKDPAECTFEELQRVAERSA